MIGAGSPVARSNAAACCIALLCLGILIAQATALFPRQFGVDFYQFWGVPVAKKASGTPYSPYVDSKGYAETLNQMSDASDSAKLRLVNRLRRNLEPMGTPFLYASFSFMPDDYVRAQALFAVIQHLATGVAVFLLARLRGIRMGLALCIAALVEVTFNPFLQDVKVGNVNSLQLLFMAMLLHVAVRRRYSGSALVDGLFVGSLAVFVMFKPNIVWIAAALALHYWITAGHRRFWIGVGVAACLGGVALAAGAWYFGNPYVWGEWLHLARALDGSGLPLSVQDGNVSLAMLLSQGSRAYGAVGFGAIIATSMMVALVIAMSAAGRRPDLVVRTALDAFSDPWFALSIGVLFTFATFPLVWPHYHLFALIPIFWLFRREGRWDAGTWGAVISYCGCSRPVLDLLAAGEFRETSTMLLILSWTALLPGVFGYVAQRRRMLEAAPQRFPA